MPLFRIVFFSVNTGRSDFSDYINGLVKSKFISASLFPHTHPHPFTLCLFLSFQFLTTNWSTNVNKVKCAVLPRDTLACRLLNTLLTLLLYSWDLSCSTSWSKATVIWDCPTFLQTLFYWVFISPHCLVQSVYLTTPFSAFVSLPTQ